MNLSIIIPTLNEADNLSRLLPALRESGAELIVSDGGSTDRSPSIAIDCGAIFVRSPRGRAIQCNAGRAAANHAQLWFLHADSIANQAHVRAVHGALSQAPALAWGRFDVSISGASACLPMVAAFMNTRSRLTGIATGDQGLFMSAAAFAAVGGFPAQPLMEDVEMTTRLRRLGVKRCPIALRSPKLITSGRRWDEHGAWHTIALMWQLRYAYWRGATPEALYQRYYGRTAPQLMEGRR